jgi:hypothetical protein
VARRRGRLAVNRLNRRLRRRGRRGLHWRFRLVAISTVPASWAGASSRKARAHALLGEIGVDRSVGDLEFGNLVILRTAGATPAGNLLIHGDLTINNSANNVVFRGATATAAHTDTFQTPFGNSSGVVYFQYATAGIAGSNLLVACSAAGLGATTSSNTFSLANTTNLQSFSVPTAPCPMMTVSYASGGGGVTFSEEMVFNSPGAVATANPGVPAGYTARYDSAITVIPNVNTVLTSTTTLVDTLFCSNITASPATVTITDDQGSPVTYVSAFSIAPNSNVQFINSAQGLTFAGGIKWLSDTSSAINCQVVGFQ